jgi:hypothetical protein
LNFWVKNRSLDIVFSDGVIASVDGASIEQALQQLLHDTMAKVSFSYKKWRVAQQDTVDAVSLG